MNLQEFEQCVLSLGESIYTQEDFYQQASNLLSQTYPSECAPTESLVVSDADVLEAA